MAITTPPEITPYPEAPQRNQAESVFVPLANTFVSSLEPRRVEMQALADWMKTATDYIDGGVQAVADSVAGATQEAKDARDAAQLAESGAVSAKQGSEDARDMALGVNRMYETIADGQSDTAEGGYFSVAGAGNSYLTLYQVMGGTGVEVARYPSQAEANAILAGAESARDISQANANFVGRWADQTGALNVPASVYHKGKYWMLLDALADVTAAEPGESGSWDYLYDGNPLAFGPGPQTLIAGDMTAGFFGEVSADELFRGDELALMVGVTEGVAQNHAAGWLKFAHNGKIKYIAKQAFRHSVTWDHLYSRGIVYGTDDNGVAPRGTATNQFTTVNKDGSQFVVRLMTCASADPFPESDPLYGTADMYQMDIGAGSEWNELMYRVHSAIPSDPLTDGFNASHGGPQVGDNWAAYGNADLNIAVGDGRYTLGQEYSDVASTGRVLRGVYDLAHFTRATSSAAGSSSGWRPVLELIPNN